MLLADHHRVCREQALAALHRFDLDAFDVELDQIAALRRNDAFVDQAVERHHAYFLAARIWSTGNTERLMLGAGQARGPAYLADRGVDGVKTIAVDLGIVRQARK